MESTTDGFKLAEIDLQYRGPWEFLWTRQSGETDIPLEILTDSRLLENVQIAAKDFIENNQEAVKNILDVDTFESLLV
jgi:ATP-dependent DNA helicase RecG